MQCVEYCSKPSRCAAVLNLLLLCHLLLPVSLFVRLCRRTTGLDYRDKGLRSSPNTTRRNYFVSRGKAAQIRTLGAGTNSTQIARAACNTTNVMDPQCTEVLLLALTPPSYSSNNTRDTTLRRAFISPAQVSSMHLCRGSMVPANIYNSWMCFGKHIEQLDVQLSSCSPASWICLLHAAVIKQSSLMYEPTVRGSPRTAGHCK